MISKALRERVAILLYSDKELVKIFNKLQRSTKELNLNLSMHRLILEKINIDADFINELNISSKDVTQLNIYKEIISNSRRIKAMTIRLKGFQKLMTVRLSTNKILIYGQHSKEDIIEFFRLLTNL